MNTIQLTISSGRHYKSIQLTAPSKWAELSPAQAVSSMRFRNRVETELASVFPLLQLLYGIKPAQQTWLFDERFLRRKGIDSEQRSRALQAGQALIDTIRWVGTEEPDSTFLVPVFRLDSFKYGSLRVLLSRLLRRKEYFTPADGLGNCSFGEFMYADQAYRKGDKARLAAVLCRPAGKAQLARDIREPFDASDIEARTVLFSQLEPALLDLIYAHYEGCLRDLQKAFTSVFPKATESDPATPAKTNTSARWLEVAISMAKLDVTKIAQIEQVNLYLALKVLEEQIRQADAMDEQMEKMRAKAKR